MAPFQHPMSSSLNFEELASNSGNEKSQGQWAYPRFSRDQPDPMLRLTVDFILFPGDPDPRQTRIMDHGRSQSERQRFCSDADNDVESRIEPYIEYRSSRDMRRLREDQFSVDLQPRCRDEQGRRDEQGIVPSFKDRADQEHLPPMPATPRPKNLPSPDLDTWDGFPICHLYPAHLSHSSKLMVKKHSVNGSHPQNGTCCRLNESRPDPVQSPDWNEYLLSEDKIPTLHLNNRTTEAQGSHLDNSSSLRPKLQ
jgi:hypothetical protein